MTEYIAIAIGSVFAILLLSLTSDAPKDTLKFDTEPVVEEQKDDLIDKIIKGEVDIDKINTVPYKRNEIL